MPSLKQRGRRTDRTLLLYRLRRSFVAKPRRCLTAHTVLESPTQVNTSWLNCFWNVNAVNPCNHRGKGANWGIILQNNSRLQFRRETSERALRQKTAAVHIRARASNMLSRAS